MAVSHLCGFELGAGGECYSFIGAGSSVQSTTKRTGTYAYRSNPSSATANINFRQRAAGGSNRAVLRSVRFYLRITTLPSVNALIASGPTNLFATTSTLPRLRLNTDGTLSLLGTANLRATSVNAFTAGDGLWHRVDFDVGYSSNNGMRVFVDGVQWAADTTDQGAAAAGDLFTIGIATSCSADIYFDDVCFHDSALPATLNDYSINLLSPVADSAKGGWTDGAGGTTTLYTSVDNIPPVGTTVASQTAGSTIKSATNSASDDYDATCATYDSITGLTTQAQILAVQAMCNDGQEITTGSPKAGAVVIASNPTGQTEQSFDFGIQNGAAGGTSAAAVGTFSAGWGTHHGPVTATPTVTVSAGPVARVGKRTATTRLVDVDALGVYVMWQSAVTVNGSQASETDTANAGTAVVVVAGAQATETDTPNAGALKVTLPGTQALETDIANAGSAAVITAGAQATETDSGNTGTPAVTLPGQQATETDTANAGTAQVTVAGSQSTETDTALSGTAVVVVNGQQATETVTANAGSFVVTIPGSQASETDTANTGSALVSVDGSLATETDTANGGTPAVVVEGSQALETDTANAGTSSSTGGGTTVAGSQAVEADTANAGTAQVSVAGSQASETDDANTGTPSVVVAGSQATETDTGLTGGIALTGSQAQETDTANPGTPAVTVQGSQASTSDTGNHGTPVVSTAGQQATETDTAFAGIIAANWPGSQATEADTALSGSAAVVVQGSQALEVDTANAGTIPIPTPADRIYVVAAETRVYLVAAESRTYLVPAENRTYQIPAEVRVYLVPAEDRTLVVT